MPQTSIKTRLTSPIDTLERAINLAKSGRKVEALNMLRTVVAHQPLDQVAWLWLSALAVNKSEAEAALAQARKINSAHPSLARAEQVLAKRFSSQPPTKASEVMVSTSPPRPKMPVNLFTLLNKLAFSLIALAGLIGLVVFMLGLGWEIKATAQYGRTLQEQAQATRQAEIHIEYYAAELENAWAEKDWTQAIAILEILHKSEIDSQAVADRLSYAYLQQGLNWRRKGYIEEALTYFVQALAIAPDQLQVQQEAHLAASYLAGTQHYQAGRWQDAINALETVWSERSDYVNIRDLLYSAYYNHGLALKAAGELIQARPAFEAAIELYPAMAAPQLQLAEIELALAQTATASPTSVVSSTEKIVVVGIAEQRMQVYEGEELVFDFVVSTGEPGRETAIGEFEIQNKIDVAYASTWNLDMPYWLGIYWAGPLQNGIHALPTVKHTGYKLWDGYLGQRVSYGCVILGDEDAATLYDWAEVGTKVKIVPSLTD